MAQSSKGPGIAWQGLEIAWQGPAAASRAAGTELKVGNSRKEQAQEAIVTDRRVAKLWNCHQKTMIGRQNKPRRREQPTAVEGARATGTRLRVCNCRQKHAQGPRATNRRREGFGRVRADLGVAKV